MKGPLQHRRCGISGDPLFETGFTSSGIALGVPLILVQ